jgi:starch synthase
LAIKDELRGALLAEAGLDTTRPLLAIVSRLAYQKGIDLVLGAMPDLLESGVNLFVLGDGDPGLETHFAELARRMPERVTAVSHFDNGLAHRLYAAADFLLMPSRYEPCGLGQMIAQRYGTPPIVRATGGLRDTVQDGVTGFCFERAAVPDLVAAVRRALTMRRGRQWDILRRRCMAVNWSWSASAQQYAEAYDHALGPSEVDRIV